MSNALRAGAVYFLAIFATGFGLGTVRVVALTPHLGETAAVLIETPVILTASWFACRFLIRKFGVANRLAVRATMGASALAMLLAAEMLLGTYGFGRSLSEMLANYETTAGAIGLVGQIVFAMFPALRLCFERRR